MWCLSVSWLPSSRHRAGLVHLQAGELPGDARPADVDLRDGRDGHAGPATAHCARSWPARRAGSSMLSTITRPLSGRAVSAMLRCASTRSRTPAGHDGSGRQHAGGPIPTKLRELAAAPSTSGSGRPGLTGSMTAPPPSRAAPAKSIAGPPGNEAGHSEALGLDTGAPLDL